MSWTEKRIQEDNCGCKESPGNKRIRKKGFLFMGLGVILAGLVFLGTMQQGVNAEKLSPERPADGMMADQTASSQQKPGFQIPERTDTSREAEEWQKTGSSQQKSDFQIPERVDPSKEAGEQAGSYDFTLGFAGDICLADNYIPMQHLAAIGSEDISCGPSAEIRTMYPT